MAHTNPLLPADIIETDNTIGTATGDMRETREMLRKILEEAFLGDALAAELMVCHLVSSVYLRQVWHCDPGVCFPKKVECVLYILTQGLNYSSFIHSYIHCQQV